MGQISARFHRHDEARRCCLTPCAERLGRRESIEGRIRFDRIESVDVILEPARRGEAGRVEAAAPMGVVPPRAADAQLGYSSATTGPGAGGRYDCSGSAPRGHHGGRVLCNPRACIRRRPLAQTALATGRMDRDVRARRLDDTPRREPLTRDIVPSDGRKLLVSSAVPSPCSRDRCGAQILPAVRTLLRNNSGKLSWTTPRHPGYVALGRGKLVGGCESSRIRQFAGRRISVLARQIVAS